MSRNDRQNPEDGGDAGARPPATTGDANGGATGGADHPRELLASYVLGLLEGDELERVEEHLARCPICAAEVRGLRATLDVLPLAVTPVTPPPTARRALMDRVAATVRGAPRAEQEAMAIATAAGPAARWPRASAGAAGWAAALACVAVAAVSTWQLVATRSELAAERQERAAAEATLRGQMAALNQLDPQATRVATVSGTPQSSAIQGRVVYQPNRTTALALWEHLPPLPADKVYQFWLI